MLDVSAAPVILIDTNVLIAAESHSDSGHVFGDQAVELLALAQRLGCRIVVASSTRTDLGRAPQPRRGQRLRELQRYVRLQPVPVPEGLADRGGFPRALGPNDRVDLEVLAALASGGATWLVTNDSTLRARAARAGFGDRVFSIAGALDTLRPLLAQPVYLPAVEVLKGYQVRLEASIMDSLRQSYPGFDDWWSEKVAKAHREVIVLGASRDPEGIAVLKPEDHCPHGLQARDVLKVCTFKIAEGYEGTKRGELLLKAVIAYARRNHLSQLYMEVFPQREELLGWLADFGFSRLLDATTPRGEYVMHKPLRPGPTDVALRPLDHNIRYGPGSVQVSRAHVVPIRGNWHNRLLPEADPQGDLMAGADACGNAIRKAYLCQANTQQVQPGDVLLFQCTSSSALGGAGAASPIGVTAVGVVESTFRSSDLDEIIRFVGPRTVYSHREISDLIAHAPVLAIRFRLDRVMDPALSPASLRSHHVVHGWAQSIARVQEEGLAWLRQLLTE